ncbi:MAG: carboxypeptidase-like regulatory domain-containing protein [Bacteroidia bacterium]
MKSIFLSLFCLGSTLNIFSQSNQLSGKIKNISNVDDSKFKIVLIRDAARIDSTMSKNAGFYNFENRIGTYDFEFSKTGYKPILLKGIQLKENDNSINFTLRFNERLPIKTIVKVLEKDSTLTDSVKLFSLDDKMEVKTTEFIDATSISEGSVSYSFSFDAAKSSSTTKLATGGYKSPSSAETAEHKKTKTSTSFKGMDKDLVVKAPEPEIAVKAGQVTAGHWRDIDNWDAWLKPINFLKL